MAPYIRDLIGSVISNRHITEDRKEQIVGRAVLKIIKEQGSVFFTQNSLMDLLDQTLEAIDDRRLFELSPLPEKDQHPAEEDLQCMSHEENDGGFTEVQNAVKAD